MTSGSNETEDISPDYREASFEIVDSGEMNNSAGEVAEETPSKLPGFGIVSGIIGVAVSWALKKRK